MTATINMLVVSLAVLTIGWILALRALSDLSPLGPLVGVMFLAMVVWGLIRATKV
jgi:hypothetical protein